MSLKSSQILRRSFLAGLGTVGAGALLRPLLQAEAQGTGPKRVLIIHRPCGTRPEEWFPTTGGEKDWGITPLLEPFAALRNQMVVLKGIDLPRTDAWPGDRHGAGMVAALCPPPSLAAGWPLIPGVPSSEAEDENHKAFTGTAASADQELLTSLPELQGTPFASLQLGGSLSSMRGSGPECLRVISYAGQNQALWPESRPRTAFDRIFGNVMTGGDAAASERLRAEEKSVLDFVVGDLNALKAKAPTSQLPKLEAHLESVRALEQQLSSSPISCAVPQGPFSAPNNDNTHLEVCAQQLALIRSAFLCDLTRVVSFTFSYGNSEISGARFPGLPASSEEGHHDISHQDGASARTAQMLVDKYYGQATATLLSDLQAIPEGDGSMLDNTLVLYFNECCLGDEHTIEDNPVLLFGGKFLGLNRGSYLKYTGRTFADLWVQTFQRFGLNRPLWGDAHWNRGALPGLYT
jgi:hypothetical protein